MSSTLEWQFDKVPYNQIMTREHGYKAVLGLSFRRILSVMHEADVTEGTIHTGNTAQDLQDHVTHGGRANVRGRDVHFITDGVIDPYTGELTNATYIGAVDRKSHNKFINIRTSRNTKEVRTEAEATELTGTNIHIWPRRGSSNDL